MLSSKKEGKTWRSSLGTLLLEVFLIVIGVMVALGANEWRENRAIAQRTDTALENIRQEILRNQTALAKRLTYHEALRDSMQAYLPDLENISLQDIDRNRLGMTRGFHFLLIYDAAWQTALTSQILPYVEYETLTTLSTIYQVQDNLKSSEALLVELIITPDNFRTGNLFYAVLVALPAMNDVIGLERNLTSLYDKALKQLNPEAYTPPDSSAGSSSE